MLPPELAEDAELGATVLDFGPRGSGRALCFDAEGTANYVNLTNIGTIVTLRGTQAGGGWLLGGGGPGGYAWHRGRSDQEVADSMTSAAPSGAAAPTLVTDALGAGLNAIDFGAYGSGRSLAVVTNATAGSVVSQQVQTVLAVVDVAQGGGTLLGGISAHDGNSFANPFGCFSSKLDARGYVNGVRVDPAKGYPYPGWVVVALQGGGKSTGLIGGSDGTAETAGGFRIAELVICKGALSEEAILDASAYLAHKWLGKSLPGYAAAGSPSRPDVQRLTTSGNTDAVRAIRVDAGASAGTRPARLHGRVSVAAGRGGHVARPLSLRRVRTRDHRRGGRLSGPARERPEGPRQPLGVSRAFNPSVEPAGLRADGSPKRQERGAAGALARRTRHAAAPRDGADRLRPPAGAVVSRRAVGVRRHERLPARGRGHGVEHV